jgi:mannose-1-phosphate guanylyltransferase/mannose-6-phosphate isomerase
LSIETVPVVLAGGSGTRLWPLSREGYPKQLLHLNGRNSLLQDTVLRLDGLEHASGVPVSPPVVVCGEEMRFLVAEQLRAVDRAPQRVLLEPVGRNTAPALTAAALSLTAGGRDPVLLVAPADHVVREPQSFAIALAAGLEAVAGGRMVTFGIPPTSAETGYGYIRRGPPLSAGAFAVSAFVEKPDLETARGYLASGDYLWNAGIFALRASHWLEVVQRLQPEIAAACAAAVAGGREDLDFLRLDSAEFAACPSNSIDYAVMEPLAKEGEQLAVVPAAMGWSDVGSWAALHAVGDPDAEGNVSQGDVFTVDTRDSLLVSDDRLLAVVGASDLVVVSTPDAVLVASRERTQDVRRVVDWLNAQGREEGRSHRRVYRPWGAYEQLDAGERYQVKRLTVKPGAELSLQMHHHRAEHWVVVRGTARVTRGEESFLLTENESTYLPLGTVHRLANPGTVELEVIEVQSGSYLGEDDIVRFEDRYDRVGEGG